MSDVKIIPISKEYKDNFDRIFKKPLKGLNDLARKKQSDAVESFKKQCGGTSDGSPGTTS